MITALYVRKDSIYKELGLDCFDIDRDARNWQGGTPVICHPPCRAWGRLKGFAKPREGEKELAFHSVEMIRKYGGVLEHPSASELWKVYPLPLPGKRDEFGGFTICIDQFWFGHKAKKKTFLYIVGVEPKEIPDVPLCLDVPTHTVSGAMSYSRRRKGTLIKPELKKSEREHTPELLAKWLVELCELINSKKKQLC